LDEKESVRRAFDGVGTKITRETDLLTERLYNHRLIRPLATRHGWIAREWPYFWRRSREPRLPSYIPARTFALALLDVLGVDDHDATVPAAPAVGRAGESGIPGEAVTGARPGAAARNAAAVRAELTRVLEILKRESPRDVRQAFVGLEGLLGNASLAPAEKLRVLNILTGAQTQLQNLHDSVEVWFNNAMDRVSGAYKRNVQGMLLVLGILIAACSNADTLDMWRRLSENDELRAAMARRAATTVEQLRPRFAPDTTDGDTTDADTGAANRRSDATTAQAPVGLASPVRVRLATFSQVQGDTGTRATGSDTTRGTTPPDTAGQTTRPDTTTRDTTAVGRAQANYRLARARLDSMELKLGWTREEAIRVGLLRKDRPGASARPPRRPGRTTTPADSGQAKQSWIPDGYHVDYFPLDTRPGLLKLLGILMTGVAISLGAPFWFDLLNKVISIRAAGRAPDERPKSPEGGPKRAAETTPR
ncbi:MAG TPA: hypothetical protein VF142_17905, partial [Longimicrobium sp.]